MVVVCAVLAGCSSLGRHTFSAPLAAARIPRDAARFEIESVDDSTARFRAVEARWIRVGATVYAVDPAQRDALVARLRVIRADSGRLTALVTSQITRVTTNHFLLAIEPAVPWYRARRFWIGVASGGVLGATSAVVSR